MKKLLIIALLFASCEEEVVHRQAPILGNPITFPNAQMGRYYGRTENQPGGFQIHWIECTKIDDSTFNIQSPTSVIGYNTPAVAYSNNFHIPVYYIGQSQFYGTGQFWSDSIKYTVNEIVNGNLITHTFKGKKQ